ncbi:hypothetical protein TWF281_008265 [Arthrobotrys megalospora]
MENVYYLLQGADRRDVAAQNSEPGFRAKNTRPKTPDTDESSSETDYSDLEDTEESEAGETDPEEDIDPEGEYRQEDSTPESSPTPEPSLEPSALRSEKPTMPITEQRSMIGPKTKEEARKIKLSKDFTKFLSLIIPEFEHIRDCHLGKPISSLKTPITQIPLRDKSVDKKEMHQFAPNMESAGLDFDDGPDPELQLETTWIPYALDRVLAISAQVLGVDKSLWREDPRYHDIKALFPKEESTAKSGLRATTATETTTETTTKPAILRYDADGNLIVSKGKAKDGYVKWARNFLQPSGKMPTFIPPPESSRDFTVKEEWTPQEFQAETSGRHPFIDPEVKMVLLLLKQEAEEAYEENGVCIWGCEYHPDDLEDITIDTLPSNGEYKPAHRGPEDTMYYHEFTSRLFASINTWIEKYIIPTGKETSIDIKSRQVLPAIKQTLRKLDYFEDSDFMIPAGEKSTKKTNAERKTKRQMFFQYIFYQVLYHNIWSHWLYGLRRDIEDHVLKLADLKRGEMNTKEGHFARGRWFTDNIRRKPTNMAQLILEHQAQIATTLRQIFVPLLNPKSAGADASKRRMPLSAEKELYMIISDAQALQLMFQSEVGVHMIVFDEPGSSFEKPWMINAASAAAMEPLNREPVPGKNGELDKRDKISLAFQPALFIDEETDIYEHIVVV